MLYMAVPSLAPGALGYLVGAPWRLTLFTDRYVRGEPRLYYSDIEVRGFKIEDAKFEISDEDVIFRSSDLLDSP